MSVAYSQGPIGNAEVPIRVMVVDDAIVVRGLVSRWLQEAGGMEVVASHRNGRAAVDDMERANPDVVILDIEMPEMDGIAALPEILRKKRDVSVVMASTLTRRNAEISMKCLSLGATDYIPKPESNSEVTTSMDFRREIVDKVRALGRRAVMRRSGSTAPRASLQPVSSTSARPAAAPALVGSTARTIASQHVSAASFKTRPFASHTPRILVIGSSTGGPQALQVVIAGLAPLIARIPVLITQHMPATFTTILAEHLARAGGCPAAEAVHGEAVRPGRIYVAPGGRHMVIRRSDAQGSISLEDGPAINFCKPAVDPMFTSAASVFSNSVLGLVLTGMGADGAHGAGDIVAAGGSIIAQDEATSVVWGMPGATAQAGHCSAVLPLKDIAPRVTRLFAGDRS